MRDAPVWKKVLLAVGILVFFVGFMFPLATTAQLVLSIGGGLLTAFAIFRWAFEPAG